MQLDVHVQRILQQLSSLQIEIIIGFAAIFLLLMTTIIVLAARNQGLRRELAEPVRQAERVLARSEAQSRLERSAGNSGILRVKVYVDHANFTASWRRFVEGGKRLDTLDWSKMPAALLAAIKDLPVAIQRSVVYAGTNVYVSYNAERYYDLLAAVKDGKLASKVPLLVEKARIESWRQENRRLREEFMNDVPSLFGYRVFNYWRSVPENLDDAEFGEQGVPLAREKLIDTSMCTDLIADAVSNVYDVALVLSGDKDFRPPVDFLQRERGKSVGLVGFGAILAGELGRQCKFTIDLRMPVNGKPLQDAMWRPHPAPPSVAPPAAVKAGGGGAKKRRKRRYWPPRKGG